MLYRYTKKSPSANRLCLQKLQR